MNITTKNNVAPVLPWDIFSDMSDATKPTTVHRFTVDPLAYLVKWRHSDDIEPALLAYGTVGRMLVDIDAIGKKYPSLVELDQQHFDTASDIRDYYKAKLVNLSLRSERLSEFRKRLYNAMACERKLEDRDIGILCKLPEFYNEDLYMDTLLENSSSVPAHLHSKPFDMVFKYIGSNDRRTRHTKSRRYWFREPDGYLATFNADLKSNSSLPVLDQYLKADNCYRIKSHYGSVTSLIGQDSNFVVYYLNNYDIEKIET